MRAAVAGVTLAGLVLAGCADVLQQRTATVEAPPPPPVPAAAEPAPIAETRARLGEQLTRLASELGELQNALAKLIAESRHQADQLQYLQRRVGELEAQAAVRTGAAPGRPVGPPPSITTTPADDLYREGVEKLRAKEADAAILLFYDLVATYPDHPLRESAQFLVADTFLGQRDFRGAALEFEALLAALPNGARTPETLVKLGLAYRGLGDEARARRAWERAARDFPGSVAARQARVLLRR